MAQKYEDVTFSRPYRSLLKKKADKEEDSKGKITNATASSTTIMLAHGLLFLMKGPGVGAGTVVVKIGLSHTNPIVFTFLRNAISAAILLSYTMIFLERPALQRHHICTIISGGILLFLTNLFYTVGIKLSSPVIGAAWQCMSPIIACAWAVRLGRETLNLKKACGLAVAIAGALFMILLQPSSNSGGVVAGSFCFFVNVNAYALYFIINKPLLKFYPALILTAWSFCICSFLMLIMVAATAASPELHALVCKDCSKNDWDIPKAGYLALAWMVLIYSIGQYGAFNWANRFIDISKITAHLTWVPLFAALATVVLVETGFSKAFPDVNLALPGVNALGGLGIITGLVLVLWDDLRGTPEPRRAIVPRDKEEETAAHERSLQRDLVDV